MIVHDANHQTQNTRFICSSHTLLEPAADPGFIIWGCPESPPIPPSLPKSPPKLNPKTASLSTHPCPVFGGDRGAKSGTLAIFAGGDMAVIERLSPVFSLLGKVNYMGGAGKGQFAKLANQITIASTMVGLVEGIVYAYRAGLDVNQYLDAISIGAAGSKFLDSHGGRIMKRDFAAGFYVNHFVKDLGICLNECQKMGLYSLCGLQVWVVLGPLGPPLIPPLIGALFSYV